MITAFHGIGAYRGQRNPLALRCQLDTALSGVELCCADRPIGAFGAVVIGDHNVTFDRDVWSSVDSCGERETESWFDDCYEGDHQSEYEQFCRKMMAEANYSRHYCESWVRPVFARALWIKDWANEKTVQAAYIISKHRKIPLIVVKGNTRIWDVLDFYNLPVRVAT